MELDRKIEAIVVEGGGVDAWLTALSLKRTLKDMPVVLKESPAVDDPLGEIVTPYLVHHLTGPCGIRLADLHRYGRPSLALGFRYRWGHKGGFMRSFDANPSQTIEGASCEAGYFAAIDDRAGLSLGEALMRTNKVAPVQTGNASKTTDGITGLQLRPETFKDLLKRACKATGVTASEGEDPRNALIVRTDGQPADTEDFIPAAGALVGRAAVTGLRRRASERLNAFGTIEEQAGGWSWRIEHDNAIGMGFAYDPEHLVPDQAEAWLASKLGDPMDGIRHHQWQPGRLAAPWSATEIRIGKAAGFVAPLIGIRMPLLVLEVLTLCRLLKETDHHPGPQSRRFYNQTLGRARDELADFTGLYMAHAASDDQGFWKSAKEQASLGKHAALFDLFQAVGPSGLIVNAMPVVPGVAGVNSWTASFLGLGIPFPQPDELDDKDRTTWRNFSGELESRARRGIEHEQALVAARR